MHISGWYDDEQIGTPLNFIGMTTHGATEHAHRRNQKLLMGPWGHSLNAGQKVGEVRFRWPVQSVIDLHRLDSVVRLLLKGEDTGITFKRAATRVFL